MDFRGSQRRPVRPQERQQTLAAAPGATSAAAVTTPQSTTEDRRVEKKQRKLWPILVAGVLVITLAVAWHVLNAPAAPRGDRFQAVYLDNGQVFFGKLKNTTGTYLILEQAFTTPPSSNGDDSTGNADANNLSLLRVSDAVYGPESRMQIRADQVIFWQDLKEDSKVSSAMQNDKSN